MSRVSQNKTELVRKSVFQSWQLAACLLLFFAVVFCGRVFARIERAQSLPVQNIIIDGNQLKAEIADDDEERSKGLSGRKSLPANHAFILSYKTKSPGNIWMKDMKFSIDILWVKADGKVVGFAKNVSPATYPKVYYSRVPIYTVVELPAGYIDSHNIQSGSTLRFQ